MPYLNVDDSEPDHPKIEALSDAAYRLNSAARAYCAKHLTDGYVSLSKARRLTDTGTDGVAMELVRANVWHDLGDGCSDPECIEARTCHAEGRQGHYIVHDYLQWNHSRDWWEKRRQQQRQRKRKSREKSVTDA